MVREDLSAYPAEASHPALTSGPVTGTITLTRWGLRFDGETFASNEIPESAPTHISYEIPPARLLIEIGETGDVIFTDKTQPEWNIWTEESGILDNRALTQHACIRSQIQGFKSHEESKNRLKLTAWFLAGFMLLAILGTLATRLMVRSLVAQIPAKWEQELGETVMQEVQKDFVFSTNRHLKVVLDRSVQPLVSALPKAPMPYRFYVMEEESPNAFALPGGFVVVTSGLIYLMEEKPEEIAGVVAHEIAHQTQRHIWRKIISSLGPYVIFTMFAGDGPLRTLGESYHVLAAQSFSQEYELEADAVGWDYLVKAQIDPRGMTAALIKLKGYQDKFKDYDTRVQALSSHPATEKRIKRLQSKWEKLKNKDDFHAFDNSPAALKLPE